jgi:FkbM family methyltransferase
MFKDKKLIGIIIFCSCYTCLYSYNEENILHQVKPYLPENPIIVEAGAHRGEDTLKMSNFWPSGMIYAFEPLPNSYEILIKKVAHCSNVQCFQYALAESTKPAHFYVDDNPDGDNGASSLSQPTTIIQNNFSQPPITVQCTTLDEWARLLNISHVDFLWLDMEGGELAALKASPTILKTVSAIYLEVNFIQLWVGIPLYQEVKQWLEKQNFREIWKFIVRPGRQANILFVRNN